MKLIDFFSPLNITTIVQFILVFFFFDILGTYIKNILFQNIKNSQTRIINWLLGLGIFIFMWFVLSLFIPYSQFNLSISIVILLIVTLPKYVINREYKLLFLEIRELLVPMLVVLPFIPAVLVKASLPPYYSDEMAYHFISPFAVLHLSPIKYVGGIYSDLPRIMNIFYEIIFSLTKTYSVARLFHFSILATSMLYSYKILKFNNNWFYGLLYIFIFFSLPQDIVLTSTLGYIDVAGYSFISIAIISFAWFIQTKSKESLIMTFIGWSLSLGTKYTGVSTFAIFLLLFGVLIIAYWKYFDGRKLTKLFSKKTLIVVFVSFIIFGGYWYLKNFILYGNPIFPFLFNCWGNHVEICPQAGGFFGDWTTKINLSNSTLILKQLFVRHVPLQIAVILSPIFAIFVKDREKKFISLLLIFSIFFELMLLKYFSGFYIRYQQYMQLYLLLAVVYVYVSESKIWLMNLLSKLILLTVIGFSLILYFYTVNYTNSLKFLNWNEINYAIGKMDIYGWIDFHFPRMKGVIKWCENGDPNNPIKLARYDPDLIWFDYDGYKRVFMLNCEYINPNLYINDIGNVINKAKEEKMRFYIASKARCIDQSLIKKLHPGERDDMLELRKLNNEIICVSEEIIPNLYLFDYSKLK